MRSPHPAPPVRRHRACPRRSPGEATRGEGDGGAGSEHASIIVGRPSRRGRTGATRARHFKMLTARATTRIATTREMASSAIIMSFIQGFTADTSVGLKAVAVAKAKWK
jgi:hypothetical protein